MTLATLDKILDKIENARADADYFAKNGGDDGVGLVLSRDDCTQIGELLILAFGSALVGKRDSALAEQLSLLAGAFKGDTDDEDDGEAA